VKFSKTKLPKEAIENLRRVPATAFAPYAIVPAPAYVYLEKNGKFVAVKGQLGFFTPAELDKLKAYKNFYLPALVDTVELFSQAGEAVRHVLTATENHLAKSNEGETGARLPLAPPEQSDALIRIFGPLWGRGARLEPFFLSFFADAVCGPLGEASLAPAHERDVDACELACLRSSTAVFLALHVGHTQPAHLAALRARAFAEVHAPAAALEPRSESDQIVDLSARLLPNVDTREISLEALSALPGPVVDKLRSRLRRVLQEFIDPAADPATLFGERGVIHE
jgi:hypothetical protein